MNSKMKKPLKKRTIKKTAVLLLTGVLSVGYISAAFPVVAEDNISAGDTSTSLPNQQTTELSSEIDSTASKSQRTASADSLASSEVSESECTNSQTNNPENITQADSENDASLNRTEEDSLSQQSLIASIYTDSTKMTISSDDTTITVSGFLPVGSFAEAYPISVQISQMEVLAAYNIEIIDTAGEIYEPEQYGKSVEVNIASSTLLTGSEENIEVYHAEKKGRDEYSCERIQTVTKTNDTDNVTFAANTFSGYVLAKESQTNLLGTNLPGTITTADSRAKGITMNLFDYDADNTQRNNYTSPIYSGINYGRNKTKDLLFFAYGTNGSTMNNYTGTNSAMQGILKETLSSNGYPVINVSGGSNLSYLFDKSEAAYGKVVYSDVNHLFTLDNDGYYRYNSDKNYARYDSSTGNFTVYNTTYNNSNNSAASPQIGFFPFNDYNSEMTDVQPFNNRNVYDHHFGLTMDSSFLLPKDGQVNGKDMVFKFSGDDDMWVFIDDVLVLDIGGIHDKTSGEIDFATGAVTVQAAMQVNTASSSNGTSTSLQKVFENAGKTYNGTDYSAHSIKVFYLERGGCFSDLSLTFNLSVYNPGQIQVHKTLSGEGAADYSNQEFKFKLYKDNKGDGNYTLYKNRNILIDGSEYSIGDDGFFKLKGGQTASISNYIDALDQYYVQETDIDGSTFTTSIDSIKTANIDNTVKSSTKKASERPYITFDNSAQRKTSITAVKNWYSADGKTLLENIPGSISATLYRGLAKGSGGTSDTSLSVNFKTQYYGTSNGTNSDRGEIISIGDLRPSTQIQLGGKLQFKLACTKDAGIYSVKANGVLLTPVSTEDPSSQKCLINNNWKYPNRTETYLIDPVTQGENIVITLIGYLSYQEGTGRPLVSKTLQITPTVTNPAVVTPQTSGNTKTSDKPDNAVKVDLKDLNAGNSWKYTWENLPTQDNEGNDYYYYVEENSIDGYTAYYFGEGSSSGIIKINNVKDLKVKKVWTDASVNQHDEDSITVKLLKNSIDTGKTIILNKANGWEGSFTNLYLYNEDGTAASYKIQEDSFTGYITTYDYDASQGYTITNAPQLTHFQIVKTSAGDTIKKLSGAVFSIYSDADCTNIVEGYLSGELAGNKTSQFVTMENGSVGIYGISPGTYYLKEVKAPDGYYLIDHALPVTIALDGKVSLPDGTDTSCISVSEDSLSVIVKDSVIYQLPSTGGVGTAIFAVSGAILICLSVLILLFYRSVPFHGRKQKTGGTS